VPPSSYPFMSLCSFENSVSVDLSEPILDGIQSDSVKEVFSVYFFIKCSQWAPTTGSENGISWLELFISYWLLGGRASKSKTNTNVFRQHSRILEEYRSFKRVFLQIIQSCVHPNHRFLFAPARSGQPRLQSYGIRNHLPCIRSSRAMLEQFATQLHRAILSINIPYKEQVIA